MSPRIRLKLTHDEGALAFAVALAGVLTLLATLFARGAEESAAQEDLASLASDRGTTVLQRIDTRVGALGEVRRFFAASDEVRPDEFATFVKPLRRERPEILAIGWVLDSEGAPLRFHCLEAAPEWRHLAELDLSALPAWIDARDEGRSHSDPTVARRDPLDPARAPGLRWFLLPIDPSPHGAGTTAPTGTLTALIDLGACVDGGLGQLLGRPDGVDSYLIDETSSELVHALPSRTRGAGESIPTPQALGASRLHADQTFVLGGQSWRLLFGPSPSFLRAHRTWMSWAVLAAGLASTATMAWLFRSALVHGRTLRRNNQELMAEVARRREAEAELSVARDLAEAANEAKVQFLANMSHELRTPLNGIAGLTRLTLDASLPQEQRENLEAVASSADLLLALIDEVLDFARMDEGKLELEEREFDLVSAVEESVQLLAEQAYVKGLEIACDISTDVPRRLRGDCVRLRQVLLNLAGNAVKFTKQGHVLVRVRARDPGAVATLLEFSVVDTGPGIPLHVQERIFSPFWQADPSMSRREGGMGLGLAICRQIAQLMGGEIQVESHPDRGSTVRFTARFAVVAEPRAPLAAPQWPARAVVIEDHDVTREILCRSLRALGFACEAAASVDAAWPWIGAPEASGGAPHVVLVDRSLPDLDPAAFARRIRGGRRLEGVRLLLMLPPGTADPARVAREAGFDFGLCKPVREAHLHARLAKIKESTQPPEVTGREPCGWRGAKPALEGLRALLAEDNAVNQRVGTQLLQKLGCEVELARNGLEALAAARSGRFDVVLMDCQMPVMDGFQATAAIRAHEGGRVHLPILAFTAHALPEERERCLRSGMDGYVVKPVAAEQLCSEILGVVRRRADAPASPA